MSSVSRGADAEAILEGTATPEEMAQLARGRLRQKIATLSAALDGRVEEHHRFLLRIQLERLDRSKRQSRQSTSGSTRSWSRIATQHARLMQIPGIDRVGAAVIIAELGVDMSVFPTPQHAAAWAGVCPGNNESAGKRKGQPGRKGNVHLTTALVQAAMGAARTSGTYLKEKFWRLKARCGPQRAALAIAHKILVAAYHMLR